MITLRDSLVSASGRRLAVRKRGDLGARRQQYQGRTYWIVKEPLGLHYFRFQEEEYAILQMLDGQVSLDELKSRFEARFPPQKTTLEELQQFIAMLHRSGLVIADAPGQGEQLLKRRRQRRRKEWLNAFTNILAFRFKGFDPERVLTWLYRPLRWLFSPWTVGACLLLAVAELTLVTVEFDAFRDKLPAFHDFFNLQNAVWLAVVLGVTKVLHEFGHGLACKHFGGECHEMGVMLLVLTPCLYCNVSDSWMLPSKWQRAAIAAAGMYVELVLAAICTFLWWFSEPGLLHYTCLNVMFVSSVSTVIFNANPLLRYDGYYILADLVEIPNLRQKATQVLARKAGEWCLGLEPAEDPFLPQRNHLFFVAYSIAAAVYRWIVLASILWFLYQVFKPYRLEIIGKAIVAVSIASLLVMPLYQLGRFFYVPGRLEKVKKARFYLSLGVAAAALAAVALVPLPFSIICTLEVQARGAKSVYVDVTDGGRLAEVFVRPGQAVEAGARLARLENPDLDIEIARLDGVCNQHQQRLASLEQQAVRDARAGGEIEVVKEALVSARRQLAQKKAERDRLTLTAPVAGVVLPPPEVPPREPPEGQVPTWSGSPFEPRNRGAQLEEGTLFCQIGDPRKLDAIMVVDQADVEFVRDALGRARDSAGRPIVDIRLEQLPHDTFRSHIAAVSESEMKVSSKRLSAKGGGELVTATDPATGQEKPRSTSFQASAPLDDEEGVLRLGLRGAGRIYTGWQPLGTRLLRFVNHTFNFRL